MQVGDCWNYALEENNNVYYWRIPQVHNPLQYCAITILSGNINTGVILEQNQVSSILYLASPTWLLVIKVS